MKQLEAKRLSVQKLPILVNKSNLYKRSNRMEVIQYKWKKLQRAKKSKISVRRKSYRKHKVIYENIQNFNVNQY